MLDPNTPQGARAIARLTDEKIIWLTTVRRNGQPQTSPVWFLFQDGEFLIYSLPGTARTANLEANPLVSLHLDGNGEGGDIVSIEGKARIDPAAPPSNRGGCLPGEVRRTSSPGTVGRRTRSPPTTRWPSGSPQPAAVRGNRGTMGSSDQLRRP